MGVEFSDLIDLVVLPILKYALSYLDLIDRVVLPPLEEAVPEQHSGLQVELTGSQETQDVDVVVLRGRDVLRGQQLPEFGETFLLLRRKVGDESGIHFIVYKNIYYFIIYFIIRFLF